jgi:hypothetical protein
VRAIPGFEFFEEGEGIANRLKGRPKFPRIEFDPGRRRVVDLYGFVAELEANRAGVQVRAIFGPGQIVAAVQSVAQYRSPEAFHGHSQLVRSTGFRL